MPAGTVSYLPTPFLNVGYTKVDQMHTKGVQISVSVFAAISKRCRKTDRE